MNTDKRRFRVLSESSSGSLSRETRDKIPDEIAFLCVPLRALRASVVNSHLVAASAALGLSVVPTFQAAA